MIVANQRGITFLHSTVLLKVSSIFVIPLTDLAKGHSQFKCACLDLLQFLKRYNIEMHKTHVFTM